MSTNARWTLDHHTPLPTSAAGRPDWLKAVQAAGHGLRDSQGLYALAFRDRFARLPKPLVHWDMEVRQLVHTGSGDAHIAETSLRLNHYGAPVIDGSSLRGLLRSATALLQAPGGGCWMTDEDRVDLLGQGGRQARDGIVSVFDAWWKPDSVHGPFKFEVDGAHAGNPVSVDRYGTKALMKPPDIFLQLVATGTFTFAVWSEDAAAARLAQELLSRALEEQGVGRGVHNSDYGRFDRVVPNP